MLSYPFKYRGLKFVPGNGVATPPGQWFDVFVDRGDYYQYECKFSVIAPISQKKVINEYYKS